MVSHLVIPDAHATPAHNNDRFDLLGRMIIEEKPDKIICIGDFADMASLSSYDKGKKSFEGRRYQRDVEACVDAQQRLFAPMNEYNQRQRKNGKAQYKPELIMVIGNHEVRINRVSESSPELDGVLSIKDLKFEEFGWKVNDFLSPVNVDGVLYNHYFISGVMGRAIGGEHSAYSMINKIHNSCVAGHSHIRDYCERTTPEGKRIQAMVVGCYLDEDQWENYAGEANKLWWRGTVMLYNVKEGNYDHEWFSIGRMKQIYK